VDDDTEVDVTVLEADVPGADMLGGVASGVGGKKFAVDVTTLELEPVDGDVKGWTAGSVESR
jgi:hypothetical protein